MITKIQTENVYLFHKSGQYVGEYMVMNRDKNTLRLILLMGERSEVCEFSRRTGKSLRPERIKGMYYIVNNKPVEWRDR